MQKDIQHIGRRKTSIARVFLRKSDNPIITVGTRDTEISKYFDNDLQVSEACQALTTLGVKDQFIVHATVKGGGKSSQAGALKLAIARALVAYEKSLAPDVADDQEAGPLPWKSQLKKEHLLTVDSRQVERKKPGLKKARKAEQYSKR